MTSESAVKLMFTDVSSLMERFAMSEIVGGLARAGRAAEHARETKTNSRTHRIRTIHQGGGVERESYTNLVWAPPTCIEKDHLSKGLHAAKRRLARHVDC